MKYESEIDQLKSRYSDFAITIDKVDSECTPVLDATSQTQSDIAYKMHKIDQEYKILLEESVFIIYTQV